MNGKIIDETARGLGKGVEKVVPQLYTETISPTAKVIGHEIARTVKNLLLPLRLCNSTIESTEEMFMKIISKTPIENLVTPKAIIALPIFEQLKYCYEEKELKELYLTLLATSMNKKVNKNVHPLYIQILKELSSDEAIILKFLRERLFNVAALPKIDVIHKLRHIDRKSPHYIVDQPERIILKNFSKVALLKKLENPNNYEIYIQNLKRLSLIKSIDETSEKKLLGTFYNEEMKYLECTLIMEESLQKTTNNSPDIWEQEEEFIIKRGYFEFSELGILFCYSCIDCDDEIYFFDEKRKRKDIEKI